jgi:hypothetical protein
MDRDTDPIPLLPAMTPEQIEEFYRSFRNKPLTAEEIEFFKNPGELVPMRQVITELKEILERKKQTGGGS